MEKEDMIMAYKPKIITGRVSGTGWPIDGHTLYFSQWDYDPENWHLYGWEDEDDEAVMLTVWQTENDAGLSAYETLEDFTAAWKAKDWEPQGSFVLEPDKVEIVEVKQEEQKNDAARTCSPTGSTSDRGRTATRAGSSACRSTRT